MENAYKMFNQDLTCTMGRGTFQYEPGMWYEEDEANVRANGFHVCKNPLDCLNYYSCFESSQCWLCNIDGDIDEAGNDTALSVQKIYLVERLTLPDFVAAACMYIIKHPEQPYNRNVTAGPAETNDNHFAISVGPDARARGELGDVLGILQTYEGRSMVKEATCFVIDGKRYKTGVWYGADDRRWLDDQKA